MQKFKVTGMSCAACSARVEKAVGTLDGVTQCSVNLLTGDMAVDGNVEANTIINAVIKAGYGIEQNAKKEKKQVSQIADNKSNKTVLVRLISSCILLAILMYFSMFHTMWGAPLPSLIADNFMAQALTQLLLTTAVMVINQRFFINGFKGIINRAPNMDTLVALGAAAAYGYSLANVFKMTVVTSHEQQHLLHGLYFESAAMILTLITVGKLLEGYAKGKTTNAIKSLLELAPKTVTLVKDGKEIAVNADEVLKDDIFIVLPGESFAVDGVVLEGSSAVDESALTGESIPSDKVIGSRVSSGTINKTGRLVCRATAVGEDSTLAKIVKMVSDASSTKAPIARVADKVSAVFVPVVLVVAIITLIVWLIVGEAFGFAIARAISVLVISCPCALGLATPVAIMVGSGVGARRGILFKTASALEMCGKCSIVVLDKTGTVTSGKPAVTDVIPIGNTDQNKLLQIAHTLENGSAHPLALAVNEYANEQDIYKLEISQFNETAGFGVSGIIDGKYCFGCSVTAAKEKGVNTDGVTEIADKLSNEGKTPLLFVENNVLIGIVAVADTVKKEAKSAINAFKKMGVRVVMLTGDNQKTANAVAKTVGIDEVKSGVKPDGKAEVITALKKEGKVIMVGDGINDAVALTAADIGMAIGSGMDIAIESADIVLTNSRLTDVVDAVKLSRKTFINIKENLFWAFIYNTIGIPLAAGVFISLLGWELNPMFGAAAMSLSSFCVVTNALRLNFFKSKNQSQKEKVKMTKVIKIEGLMCPHCEAHAKTALENLGGVTVLDISHKTGIANVELSENVADEALKNAVESQGYKVISVE
ncbi:MAG: heavy metal translocating P-type ATPase [Clostridia bacterium]|nr:heavy metal translocating P-type ATPase [Clostridia bacterium]